MGEHKYRYEFIRLDKQQRDEYHEVIHTYAEQGWRLVQVLAPGAGGPWASADYFELIFEQPIDQPPATG